MCERFFEIVVRSGDGERVVPARWFGVEGVAHVLRYGQPNERMTRGAPPLDAPEHSLTRAALNEVDRLLDVRKGGDLWGLPGRPLSLGETLSVQVREVREEAARATPFEPAPPRENYLGRGAGPPPLPACGSDRGSVPHCAAGCLLFQDSWEHHRDCSYVAWVLEQARALERARVEACRATSRARVNFLARLADLRERLVGRRVRVADNVQVWPRSPDAVGTVVAVHDTGHDQFDVELDGGTRLGACFPAPGETTYLAPSETAVPLKVVTAGGRYDRWVTFLPDAVRSS